MKILLLDLPGTIASLAIGILIIAFSGGYAAQNLILILFFLIASVAATKYKYREKKEKGLYEFERSWQNVISNGVIAALCPVAGFSGWLSSYICAIAAATSDKFSSELGVLSGKPLSLLTLKPVRAGTSGAMSLLGTFMSFVGALLVGFVAYFLFKFDPFNIFTIALIGFAGSLTDTLVGVAEELGIGNKQTSNIICTLSAAALGYVFRVI